MGHSRPLFIFLIFVSSIQLTVNNTQYKFCQWLDSNCGPLECRKQSLYQLSHNHRPCFVSYKKLNSSSSLFSALPFVVVLLWSIVTYFFEGHAVSYSSINSETNAIYLDRPSVHYCPISDAFLANSETSIDLDRPSVHYCPISDAFVNKEYLFLHVTNDSTLPLIDDWPVSYQ